MDPKPLIFGGGLIALPIILAILLLAMLIVSAGNIINRIVPFGNLVIPLI